MAIADTIREFLANTITDNFATVLLVALGAIAVALALSFIARIAFWALGIGGTLAAVAIVGKAAMTSNMGAAAFTLAGIVLVGGWIGGYLVKGMIKFGSVVVTLFGYAMFWLTGWAAGNDTNPEMVAWGAWPALYHGIAAAVLVAAVLAIPTIMGKVAVGAVKTIVPGGGEKKKDEKKPAEIKR